MNPKTEKVLKALNGLSIKQATHVLLSALHHVAADADHPEVYKVMSEMLVESAEEFEKSEQRTS